MCAESHALGNLRIRAWSCLYAAKYLERVVNNHISKGVTLGIGTFNTLFSSLMYSLLCILDSSTPEVQFTDIFFNNSIVCHLKAFPVHLLVVCLTNSCDYSLVLAAYL